MKTFSALIALLACAAPPLAAAPVRVEIHELAPGRFELLRDGAPFFVRGAGGAEHLDRLAGCGANSLRTWGTDQTERVIDEAQRRGLTVCAGLWIEHSKQGFDYGNASAVRAQIERHERIVDRFKDHPALLVWAVGNELDLGCDNDPRAWDVVEAIAAYIKKVDRAHPVMTVTTHPSAKAIGLIKQHCPSIALLGFNSYGGVSRVAQQAREFGWNGPYLVTEWGCTGTWEIAKTAWGAPLEPTSTDKAMLYAQRYAAIVADRDHCLGSYAFLWGQKQEGTPTWFGLFTEDGAETEAVGVLQNAWGAGRVPVAEAPRIGPLRLRDNRVATCAITRGDVANLRVSWVLLADDGKKSVGGAHEDRPGVVLLRDESASVANGEAQLEFSPPTKPGAYRLYVYVHGPGNTVATANVPFLIAAQSGAVPPAEKPFVQVRGKQFVGPDGAVLKLRGINLGNWLLPEGYMWKFKQCASPRHIENLVAELVGDVAAAEFWRQWRESYITRDDIRLIRRAGFNNVRVPLNWRLFVDERGPTRLDGPGWALLDRVIEWCREEKLYVILDLHGAPGGQTGANIDDSRGRPLLFEDPAAQQLTTELWVALAARYRDEPWVLGYDVLNEPIAHTFDTARLNPRLGEFYRSIVPAIRAVDPQHVILLAGAQWNTIFEPLGEPFAPNLAYTCHLYWDKPEAASIARYLAWREKTGAPMWLGETGENTDEWIEKFRTLLDEHDIGWCFWPYKKMDAPSCVASLARPDDWAAIIDYAETPRGNDYDAIRKALPPLEVSRRALVQLLENIRIDRCAINAGYLHALGLETPARN